MIATIDRNVTFGIMRATKSILEETVNLCKEIALYIREQLDQVSSGDIEVKDMNSLVSYVDKEAEKSIIKKLTELVPEAGFITEEGTSEVGVKKINWIIDPLDGTTNFLRGIPHFSTSIALMEDDVITLGVVYDIMLDVAYSTVRGEGASANGKLISVSTTKETKEAIVATGFPYRRDAHMNANFKALEYCVLNCRGVRRFGSAALDLAYVASGKFDAYYENTLNIWDIAAGVLLIEEAGGRICDYSGGTDYLNRGGVIAVNNYLFDDLSKGLLGIYSS